MQVCSATALFHYGLNQYPQAIINCTRLGKQVLYPHPLDRLPPLSDGFSASKFNFSPSLKYVEQINELPLPQSDLGKGASFF